MQRFSLGWSALGKVLILAREEVVAVLLGLMVELRGLEPVYLAKAEIAEELIRRVRPEVVVVDCDHQDCTDSLLDAVRESGAKPILFSPFRFESEVRRVAARHGVESFTLPTDPESFGRMLRA
jgi:DNA-binding response OmpR family regulator